jgi:hypothetical protein
VACGLLARVSSAAAPEWQTHAERTGFRETGDYDETMRYCRRLERASPWVKLVSYGTSGQGRQLPLLIVSRDRAFTPERARRLGRPIVLVQNGIHSGEIEGKDATLALVRDLAVAKTRAALLENVTLLVLPIFSVDAHERRSPYNRINQNGPAQMGWRSTPIGLNLNRDYLKVETPEMRALISQVFARWRPHLLVDNHTTDGADYQYDLTYGFDHGPVPPGAVARWLVDVFEGRVVPRLAAMGHVVGPYAGFRDEADPRRGIEFGGSTPRFSTGYAPLHGRPAVLVETHMLKPYDVRVRATYDLMVALLEELNADPGTLLDAVRSAEEEVLARARDADPERRQVVLLSRLTAHARPFRFRGVAMRREWSDLAGAPVTRYGTAPWDTVIPLYRELEPAVTVRQPAGYLVPREWSVVQDRLDVHGVRYRRLGRAWSDTVELQRIAEWRASPRTVEGHRPTLVGRVALERRLRGFRPGDLWVPLDQPAALVAIHLLEAQAPDGLMYWNAFDTVIEKKEYAEVYVMEPIARRMAAEDTALLGAFRARVAADSALARDPAARMDFFYRRSPWADPEQDLHPAARALRPPPEDALARP